MKDQSSVPMKSYYCPRRIACQMQKEQRVKFRVIFASQRTAIKFRVVPAADQVELYGMEIACRVEGNEVSRPNRRQDDTVCRD